MTRHIHADHIIAAVNDTSIRWEGRERGDDNKWQIAVPIWREDFEYRQAPKKKQTVDMWLWACRDVNFTIYVGTNYFKSAEEFVRAYGYAPLCRVESSKITIEVEE